MLSLRLIEVFIKPHELCLSTIALIYLCMLVSQRVSADSTSSFTINVHKIRSNNTSFLFVISIQWVRYGCDIKKHFNRSVVGKRLGFLKFRTDVSGSHEVSQWYFHHANWYKGNDYNNIHKSKAVVFCTIFKYQLFKIAWMLFASVTTFRERFLRQGSWSGSRYSSHDLVGGGNTNFVQRCGRIYDETRQGTRRTSCSYNV
jgi:hypothetical protein